MLTFASPLVLVGLALLPIVWWLLRVTPPRPELEIFPPLKILARVLKSETTPRKTPWWLLLIRLLLTAAIIFAIADPVLNPVSQISNSDKPLVIIVDNGWTSQRIAEAQIQTATSLIAEAQLGNRTIYVSAMLQSFNTKIGPFDAPGAKEFLASINPVAATTDRKFAIEELVQKIPRDASIAILSDGIAGVADDTAYKGIERANPSSIVWFKPTDVPFRAITQVTNQPEALEIEIANFGVNVLPAVVAAFDAKGRRVGEATVNFGVGQASATARLVAPFELRNDVQALSIQGERHAGATFVTDENLKRRRVVVLSSGDDDQANPILSSTYYIRKALAPFADLIVPKEGEFSAALKEGLTTKPSIIIMADIGYVPQSDTAALEQWVQNGGTLLRFAGPRLATSAQDQFLPVNLREGERALGGSMSWTEPQMIDEFSAKGPFATLALPQDVAVKRQVLAEPDPDLARKTWASLTDGTPLVTADNRGKGMIILFHVSPQATWSNLPISGSFVDMLRQVLVLARNPSGSAAATQDASLNPWRIISASGVLGPAPSLAKPARFTNSKAPLATLENPPGLYGNEDGATALNLVSAGTQFSGATIPEFSIKPDVRTYVGGENKSLKGPLLGLAALIFLLDCLAMIFMSRGSAALRQPVHQKAAAFAVGILLIALMLEPHRALAFGNDAMPGDAEASAAVSQTRLAFIKSGDTEIDKIALEGLQGLTLFLKDKTALEPAEPVGVDPEIDELAFYPLLYWPINPDAPMPSPTALQQVDAYMQAGGSLLFDTRDQASASLTLSNNASPANERLRAILETMNVPPLEPVPSDHVLTKSFYLIDDFPGRYNGSPLWIEQVMDTVSGQDRPVRTGDGVSPIMITGNDFASAWALTKDGLAVYPTEGGSSDQRIYALRAGVNIVMYTLTGNYKADQVHIPSLLERLGQ